MNLDINFWVWNKGLPQHFCDEIIQHGNSFEQKEGVTRETEVGATTLKKQQKKIRSNKVAWLEDRWIYDQIVPFINDANKQAGWNFNWIRPESCQFTTYYGSGKNFYDWHLDMATKPYESGSCKGLLRKLSMVILLNNPSEFEGGKLQFDFRDKRKKEIIDAKFERAGSLVVFPSFLWHRVTPVTKGIRYSLVVWVCGESFK